MIDWRSQHVLVTGGAGFLGRSVVLALQARGVDPSGIFVPRQAEFDLRDPAACRQALSKTRPTLIIHCAGLVGGLGLNRSRPADMFRDNLLMAVNICDAAIQAGFAQAGGGGSGGRGGSGGKLVMIGSMTSYPASAPLPYREESLFTGLPDPEIASYGIAKLVPLQMLRACRTQHGLRSAFPILVNLYGPGDNIDDPQVSHVAGALIKRFVDAADSGAHEVVCWGTGSPTRDFIFIDDAAEGVLCAAEVIDDASPVNIASGREVTIRSLAEAIARAANFRGTITWDPAKRDGVSRRCLDISRANSLLGWEPKVSLEDGLRRTIDWYRRTKTGGR